MGNRGNPKVFKSIEMKIIYYNYVEYVIGQAIDAIFAKDLYDAYKARFNEIKDSVIEKDLDNFFQMLKESLKITLNNLEKVELFQFFSWKILLQAMIMKTLKKYLFLCGMFFFLMKNGWMKITKTFLLK
ncbi:conserved hypothetical protein [Chryseobacterium sp. 8AT]|nr:conserved hypothetical protein [Chryseobacterium sp. 8AT]